ncbi:MAG: S-methyl-5-thioribose-1-phosphate isomerase [Deltaproteobacteria bacterium]|nr:S-methyl-5-thioribose-1-phosphate isomerase [Deltaproteobacteria bacterium]
MSDFFTIRWSDSSVAMIDQRLLPHREAYRRYKSCEGVAGAIRSMVIRGAPAIGIAAGFGMALEARSIRTRDAGEFVDRMRAAGDMLVATRPTAINLAWAVRRVMALVEKHAPSGVDAARRLVLREARRIMREDEVANRRMGRRGALLFSKGSSVLTHCNAGALAVGAYGTAIGVIRAAHEAGRIKCVFVDETRPYLQGARLTAWELKKLGIPHFLITDSMAGHFMQRGEVDAVMTGADRIAANGDTANKIGTYSVAVLAKENRVPFFVAAPASTFDLSVPSGESIPVEERDPDEVCCAGGRRIAPHGTPARYPAFDVTPARYIAGIITEFGVLRPPFGVSIARVIPRQR